MEISVIIVAFNSSSHIEACLCSIFEQVKGMDSEFILVDNASEDMTCEIIKRRFPEVTLIRSKRNEGFAKANNLALIRATGEFILLVNPDTFWRKGRLAEVIGFMKDHPEIGAVGAQLILEDGSWQKSYGYFPTLSRELKETLYLPRFFPRSQWMKGVFSYTNFMSPEPVDWVSCTFFLCPRELMAEIGFFDERYFMYYEDIDLSKRIREKGKKIYYYPQIEIVHRQRWPSVVDFGGSPYIYYEKFFGLFFAYILRYIFFFKISLRIWIFFIFTLFSGKAIFKDKLESYCRTFKFHLFEAPKVLRFLRIESRKESYKRSDP